MEKSAVISELETIFRDYFDDPDLELTPETSQETIEDWDSLAQISLLVAIEKHFQVRFSMNQAAVRSSGSLAMMISGKGFRNGAYEAENRRCEVFFALCDDAGDLSDAVWGRCMDFSVRTGSAAGTVPVSAFGAFHGEGGARAFIEGKEA